MRNNVWLKLGISIVAAAVAVVHIALPDLKIDAVTFGLILVVILPWLTSLIESAKFPGGWEVKFRNVENAGQKVISEAPAAVVGQVERPERATFQFWAQDPNVALVALRIDIEKRIRAIAERAGIPEDRSMMRLFHRLREKGVLQDASLSGLQELVAAGNQAAHGASVEPNVAFWAFEYGPQVIAALDARLQQFDMTG